MAVLNVGSQLFVTIAMLRLKNTRSCFVSNGDILIVGEHVSKAEWMTIGRRRLGEDRREEPYRRHRRGRHERRRIETSFYAYFKKLIDSFGKFRTACISFAYSLCALDKYILHR